MRLRSTLLTAALAGTLAVGACGGGSPEDATDSASPTGPSGGSAAVPETPGPGTEIPDDFPLSAGMGGPQDAIPTSRTGTGLRDLALCGTAPLRGLGVRDRMIADNSGGESANTRELVLLGSPDEAALVARAFTDLPSGCRTPTVNGDMETVTEVRRSPFGPTPAVTLIQTYTFDGEPGTGATVIHVVPVGAALLITSTYGEWTDAALEQGVTDTVDAIRETVAGLDLFAEGTPSGGASPEPTESPEATEPTEPTAPATAAPDGVTEIPADFPLGVGLPEGDGETRVSTPSADGEGVGEVEICGTVAWPRDGTAGGVRRLVTRALGPEYFDGRELLVHADAEVAGKAMAAVRQAAESCRSLDNQVWTVLDRDTGHDTVTMGLTYDQGLGSSVFQVTRVGSARLMVSTYGEGSLASLDEQADQVTGTTGKIVPAMCVFTRTGC
ncbi:hypothetical protein [Nocardioides sp.]|uniref:hypothetical protein n=1 Tax=Nocardioides sp. TaxID=35761 RepID=UPI00262B0DEF|nr:hypothetical protein [Nocardioides sp.]MCW2737571.1 hypothetical protein [Nocardioides sp.]